MNARRLPETMSCALLAALASGHAGAQSSMAAENAAAARQAAMDAAARPLVEADKARVHIGGYWRIAPPVTALKTVDGKDPALTPAGRTLYRQRQAAIKAGKSEDPTIQCLPPGTPRSLTMDEPFMLAQTPAKVTFFHQFYHVIRHVYLDGPLKLDDDRQSLWEGKSSGRWEGNTLVIESGDFNGRQWLDASGLPQSPDMRVTERIRRVDGDTLEDVITYDDAKYYTKPWTTRLTFRAQPASTLLVEEDCAEKLLDYPMKPYAPE